MTPALRAAALLWLAACAPADPGWESHHAADPEAPTGAEVPVARVLREAPERPAADEPGEHAPHGERAAAAPPADEPVDHSRHGHRAGPEPEAPADDEHEGHHAM